MARVRPDQPLLPSVLDRLLDDSPGETREAPRSRSQMLRELKHSVRRDLENLLNSRRPPRELPDDLPELRRSLVSYGVPDVTDLEGAGGGAREALRLTIEEAIRQFEPRFKSVAVELLDNAEPLDRTLRFRIRAMIWAEPAPELAVFDTSVEPATGTIAVQGAPT